MKDKDYELSTEPKPMTENGLSVKIKGTEIEPKCFIAIAVYEGRYIIDFQDKPHEALGLISVAELIIRKSIIESNSPNINPNPPPPPPPPPSRDITTGKRPESLYEYKARWIKENQTP